MRHVVKILAIISLGCVFGIAQATPINNSYSVTVWNTDCSSCTINSPQEQALPTNPLATSGTPVASLTYTGDLDFFLGGTGTSTIAAFFNSGSGSYSLGSGSLSGTLSSSGFGYTTLMEFSGTASQNVAGTITHDDGISLYQNGGNVVPVGAAHPTSAESTSFTLGHGAFNLWYVEANGLPAQLNLTATAVPEPSAFGIFALGLGLVLLGFMARRRRSRHLGDPLA